MKKLMFTLCIVYCFSYAQCVKDKLYDDGLDDSGLPHTTQEGKNTLGFMLNGEPWMPAGNNGTGNLSIDFDPGFNNGIVGIVAYRWVSNSDKTQFLLGLGDSSNFINAPKTLIINSKSLAGLSFTTKEDCYLLHRDSNLYESGRINITKLDRTNHIVAGTFEGVLYKSCSDTLRITNGRFDMKF